MCVDVSAIGVDMDLRGKYIENHFICIMILWTWVCHNTKESIYIYIMGVPLKYVYHFNGNVCGCVIPRGGYCQ